MMIKKRIRKLAYILNRSEGYGVHTTLERESKLYTSLSKVSKKYLVIKTAEML